MNRRVNQKNKKKKIGNRKAGSRLPDMTLALKPEFPGQPVCALKVQSGPIPLSTTVTTGLIALNAAINSGLVNAFATRFAAFNEWRIVKAKAHVMCFDSTNPGVISQWYESAQSSTTPNAVAAENAPAQRFNASAVDRTHDLSYVPHDPGEQAWTPVGTAFTSGNYKIYTDNANYGASIAAKGYLVVNFDLTFQFRGFI